MTRAGYPAPRWQTPLPPDVSGSWGPAVAEYAERVLSIRLDRWQRRALDRALAYTGAGPDRRLVHRHYLVSTGRQNGKTAIVRALIGFALTTPDGPPWSQILGLANDKRQARIPYKAVRADLAPIARRLGPSARGGLALTQYLGIRSTLYGRAREYDVASREAADAIRGLTVDLAVFDEVRTQRGYDTWSALEPTTTANPQALIFAISSAGNDRSVLLRDWWERGRRIIDGIEPPAGFGMTWYAAPDGLEPDDPRAWRAASPAMADGRIDPATIRGSLAGMTPSAFRMERLNLWPDAGDEWLPSGLWADTTADQPTMAAAERVILGVEVVPSWHRATITVAIATPERVWVGIAAELVAGLAIGDSVSPADLIATIDAAAATWTPSAIAYSGSAAAAPHVAAWTRRAGARLIALTTRQIRQASELFRSELVGRRLSHGPDPLLARQSRDARPSAPIESGSWYISIRESAGDVDAIRAAAWASWAAIAPPDAEVAPQVFL